VGKSGCQYWRKANKWYFGICALMVGTDINFPWTLVSFWTHYLLGTYFLHFSLLFEKSIPEIWEWAFHKTMKSAESKMGVQETTAYLLGLDNRWAQTKTFTIYQGTITHLFVFFLLALSFLYIVPPSKTALLKKSLRMY